MLGVDALMDMLVGGLGPVWDCPAGRVRVAARPARVPAGLLSDENPFERGARLAAAVAPPAARGPVAAAADGDAAPPAAGQPPADPTGVDEEFAPLALTKRRRTLATATHGQLSIAW